jgi:hypothetical protein
MRQEVNSIKTESEKQEKKYGADSISKMRLCTWVGSCFTNIEYATYLPKINSIKVIKSTCTPPNPDGERTPGPLRRPWGLRNQATAPCDMLTLQMSKSLSR